MKKDQDNDIELLLAHADDAGPVLEEGLSADAMSVAARPEPQHAESFLNESADPNDLEEQRWGIIAPEGPLGDRLLGLIEPLRKLRQEEQGGAEVRVYRVPPGMTARGAGAWRDKVYHGRLVATEDLPRYLLLLGEADAISLEFQQALGNELLVGRLGFPSDRGYEAYVDKVLRWKRARAAGPLARALFYTVRDGTAATTIGHRSLLTPSIELASQRAARGTFPVKEIVEIRSDDGPSIDDFLSATAAPDPAVLFSISHGLGMPKKGWGSTDEQRAVQGAMSFGAGQRISADVIADRPFLPGGVWFFLACYGGATPSTSAYVHWLSALKKVNRFSGRLDPILAGLPREGDRPFLAALPTAALANPDGPLAVMAHVDLAWTYSFQDVGGDGGDQPSRFQGTFKSLVNGSRVGVAYFELMKSLVGVNNDLTAIWDTAERAGATGEAGEAATTSAPELAKKANLWMLRQDLSGYILLGDPAARLPIDPRAARTQTAQTAQARPEPAAPVAQVAVTPPPRAPARDPEGMEEAVLAAIHGDEAEKVLAERHGISLKELRAWKDAYQEAGRAALARLA